jgi:hypothetical protein
MVVNRTYVGRHSFVFEVFTGVKNWRDKQFSSER